MSTLHPSRHLGSAACSGHTDSDCRSSTSGGSREWHRRHGITSDSNDSRCSRMDTYTDPKASRSDGHLHPHLQRVRLSATTPDANHRPLPKILLAYARAEYADRRYLG